MSSAVWLRQLRLVSGLVLMVFVASHLADLAFGLRSLAAIDAAEPYLMGPWLTPAGDIALILATVVHTICGFQSIVWRRSLIMSRTDVVQVVLALLVPPLLVAHVMLTRFAREYVDGFVAGYGLMLALYWKVSPVYGLQQLAAVFVVWIHAAIGMHSRLVLLPVWRRIGALVVPLLFGVPILALLGFIAAGKEVLDRLATDAAFRDGLASDWAKIAPVRPRLDRIADVTLAAYAVLCVVVIAAVLLRVAQRKRRGVRVLYDGGLVAEGRPGLTILEIGRAAGVPHAHVCSGRGRCGTCRVEVEQGGEFLSPVEAVELRLLKSLHTPPGVRLACQARVLGPQVRVTRLLPAFADASAAREPEQWEAEEGQPARTAETVP